jgi:hypothetical protein
MNLEKITTSKHRLLSLILNIANSLQVLHKGSHSQQSLKLIKLTLPANVILLAF